MRSRTSTSPRSALRGGVRGAGPEAEAPGDQPEAAEAAADETDEPEATADEPEAAEAPADETDEPEATADEPEVAEAPADAADEAAAGDEPEAASRPRKPATPDARLRLVDAPPNQRRPDQLAPEPDRGSPPFVGLTGGIAAGKSEALAAFARLGAATLSTDAARPRAARRPGDPRAAGRALGRGGARRRPRLDRDRVGEIVFERPEELALARVGPSSAGRRAGRRVARRASARRRRSPSSRCRCCSRPGWTTPSTPPCAWSPTTTTRARRAGDRGTELLEGSKLRQLSQEEKAARATHVISQRRLPGGARARDHAPDAAAGRGSGVVSPARTATGRASAAQRASGQAEVAPRRRLLIAAAALLGVGVAIAVSRIDFERAIREITLPLRHDDIIRQQAAEKHLDPALIAAVIYAESRFRDQKSHAGALGLMQITPETARGDRPPAAVEPSSSPATSPTRRSTSATAPTTCATCSTATTATRSRRWPPTTREPATSTAGAARSSTSTRSGSRRRAPTCEEVLDKRTEYRDKYADDLGLAR